MLGWLSRRLGQRRGGFGLRSPLRREGDLWWEEEGKREGRKREKKRKEKKGGGIRRVVVEVLVDLGWLVGFC